MFIAIHSRNILVLLPFLLGCGQPVEDSKPIEPSVSIEHKTTPPYIACAEASCGAPCTVCAPNDGDCFETAVVKICNAKQACVAKSQTVLDACAAESP